MLKERDSDTRDITSRKDSVPLKLALCITGTEGKTVSSLSGKLMYSGNRLDVFSVDEGLSGLFLTNKQGFIIENSIILSSPVRISNDYMKDILVKVKNFATKNISWISLNTGKSIGKVDGYYDVSEIYDILGIPYFIAYGSNKEQYFILQKDMIDSILSVNDNTTFNLSVKIGFKTIHGPFEYFDKEIIFKGEGVDGKNYIIKFPFGEVLCTDNQ